MMATTSWYICRAYPSQGCLDQEINWLSRLNQRKGDTPTDLACRLDFVPPFHEGQAKPKKNNNHGSSVRLLTEHSWLSTPD